jgi:hypothetical protein
MNEPLTEGNGHCRDQPGGCTEFQLLRQEVKNGLSPKLQEVDERTKETEKKVDGFEDKLDKLMWGCVALIVTIIIGCGSIVAAIVSKG